MDSKKSKLVTVVGNVIQEKGGSLVHGPVERTGVTSILYELIHRPQ
jgi:hypothetical protein